MFTTHSRLTQRNYNHSQLSFYSPKNRATTAKDQFQSTMASLGIGSLFLIGSYLFLSQLAQYGW